MASIEWETPQEFFDKLNAEFAFDIDLCASKHNAKLPNYFSISENALYQKWVGSCWLNPPYDRDIGRWIAKAYESAQEGAMVVCLLQCRSGDTKWFHNFVMKSSEMRFIKDRLHFGLKGKFSRANISSIVVVFRPYCTGPPLTSSIDTKGNPLNKHIDQTLMGLRPSGRSCQRYAAKWEI